MSWLHNVLGLIWMFDFRVQLVLNLTFWKKTIKFNWCCRDLMEKRSKHSTEKVNKVKFKRKKQKEAPKVSNILQLCKRNNI